MAEEVEVYAHVLEEAIRRLMEYKPPKHPAPINDVLEMLESEVYEVPASKLIEAFVLAGYGLDDIRRVFEEAGIVQDADDWMRMRNRVARAVLTIRVREETGE